MFTESDGDQVRALFKQLTTKETQFDPHACSRDRSSYSMVIENEEQNIVGFGCLVVYLVPTKGIVGRIEDIVVDRNFRGQGLGRKLLQELLLLAKGYCVTNVSLTSAPSRVEARALYESLGFKLRDTGVFEIHI